MINQTNSRPSYKYLGILCWNVGGVQIEEYVAIGDFTAKPQSNQLSVKKCQVVNVLVREGGWWFCESEGKSGWAPSTYLAELKEDEVSKDADGMVQPISERNEGK